MLVEFKKEDVREYGEGQYLFLKENEPFDLERQLAEALIQKGVMRRVKRSDILSGEFPQRELLETNNILTFSRLAEVTDEELLEIDGIGNARLKEIREAAAVAAGAEE